jgi:hypothetical protein
LPHFQLPIAHLSIEPEAFLMRHNSALVYGTLFVLVLATRVSAAAPHANSRSNYVLWQDPAEGAFSLSVPVGWQTTGGTVRSSQIDVHYVVRSQSPDGGAQLFMDDPRILMREVPNRGTQMIGVREGQVMPAGGGTNLMVERYRPGAEMAAEYIRKSFCPTATMMQGGGISGQTQDLNQEMQPAAQAEGKQIHADVGEVSFKCGEQAGYVYAITVQVWQPGGAVSIWAVYRIAGYLTSPEDSAAAAAAMQKMLGTFQMNQQWLQAYAKECGDVAGNVIRESNAITQSTIERARQQEAAEEAANAQWKKNSDANINANEGTNRAINGAGSGSNNGNGHDYNAQLGTKKVCDDLDRCTTVDAGVDNWWSDCSGTFYPGSDTGEAPSSSTSACWHKGH